MVQPSSYSRAFASAVTGLLVVLAVLTGAAAPSEAKPAPPHRAAAAASALSITIDSLAPGILPRQGPLVVSGTVTNVDLEAWSGIKLYPFFSGTASCSGCTTIIRSPRGLAQAAAVDADSLVGERWTEVSDDIATLEPGESESYTLRIPQAVLRDPRHFANPTQGVYWFGVHALGSSASHPSDKISDGKARTFLPYLRPRTTEVADVSVVVPLRQRIERTSDGKLASEFDWDAALGVDGTLGGPLAFGMASGSDPLTWLVDPAVPDAVADLAKGNPARAIVSPAGNGDGDDGGDGDGDGGDGATSSPSATSSESPDAKPEPTPLQSAALSWLDTAHTGLTTDPVALLPYGDLDLAAVNDTEASLFATARATRGSVLTSWNVTGTPVLAGPGGYLDATRIPDDPDPAKPSTVLVGDPMLPRADTADTAGAAVPPAAARIGDRQAIVTSTGAASGGPGPDPETAPIALRQRLLSEAALRIIDAQVEHTAVTPLVVVLPAAVGAEGADDFWSGIDDVPWVRTLALDDVPGLAPADAGVQLDPSTLLYPDKQREAELSSGVVFEAGRLLGAARTLQGILGEGYRIGPELVGDALAGSSYEQRGDEQASQRLVDTRAWVEEQLAQVTIEAPNGVTLSGTAGSFGVAVRNSLDFPVSVQVVASTDDGAQITVDNPVELAPNSRSSVRIDADMSSPGVHNVTLRLTDPDGQPLGATDKLPIRSGQVGTVIWVIIGTGVGILFVAIVIRLVRRIRSRGSRDGAGATSSTTEGPA